LTPSLKLPPRSLAPSAAEAYNRHMDRLDSTPHKTTHRNPSWRRKHARMVPFDQKRMAYDSVEMVAAWPAE
jgi:hypothetical protein